MQIDNPGAQESAPAQDDGGDHLAGAADILRELRSSPESADPPADDTAPPQGEEQPAGDPPPAPAAETPPAKQPPPAASWLDTERELQAKIEAKRAEQQQQAEAAQRSETEARAAQREQELQTRIAEFERDPVAYFAKYGQDPRPAFKRMAELATKGPAAKVEDTIESLRAEIAELKQQVADPKIPGVEEIQQWRADQERQRAEAAFVEHASSAESYPLLSRLPPESRVELAHQTAARFRAAGMDFDLAAIA